MAEIDDTQLLSLNDFQEVSTFTENKNIMVWEAADEDPSKISGTNFIASMRQLFIEGVNAFLKVDYFSQSAPSIQGLIGREVWVSYDGILYEYDPLTNQWIFDELADKNTVYIADDPTSKIRYSVIFRNGTYILLSMVDLANSINDTAPISTTTTFSSKKVTELLADEKDPLFNAWLIDNAAYLQILLDDAPANPSTKFLNGLRQWVDVAVVGGGGYQAPLYITNLPSFVAGYKQIAYERQEIGFQTDITLRNETVLVNTFLFEGQIDTTTIDSGNYIFASRAKIDSAGGNTHFRIAPFLRHANGSETVLFTFDCDEITYTSYQDVQKSFPYGTITCVETDRFGFRLYLVTASTSNKTVNLLGGDGYPTFLVTPARLRHNQLRDLNGDEAHLHITQSEKTNFVTASDFVEDFISNATDITREGLLNLIDNNELIPSSSYRITDYTTTTIQADTTSAGHDFDIIVTALSTNELSENAKCVRKSDDTYFENAKLEAWEIKYCIDNDTSRFAWADTENGKGVIYYMKDEFENECPYDFKNIQFKRYPIISMPNGSTDLVFDVDNQKMKYAIKDSYNNIYPTGAVIDENNASYYFTFNAILQESETYDIYDASVIQNGIKTDEGDFAVQNNKINEAHTSFDNPYDYGQLLKLNNIVINNIINSLQYTELSYGCYSNTFGNNCTSNTFGYNCGSNTFGDNCNSNTFGYNCNSNTFGNNCTSNTFGNDCYSNTFGYNCNSNTFGNNCTSNTFGNDCYSNTFGNDCYSNTFGNNCTSNTFGNDCSSNTFGNDCNSNTFGVDCHSNTFGDNCNSNTFGYNCNSNTFGNNCTSNTFGNDCYSNTFGYNCNSNTFGNNCTSNTFGNNCSSNTFGNYCSSNTFGNYCSSNTFGDNCFSNTFGDNCGSNTFGDNCGYNEFGNGCGGNNFGNYCSSNTFGNYCNFNNFYVGTSGTTKKDYIKFIVLEDGCAYNNFYSALTTSGTSFLQRIRIKGLDNTTPTDTIITLSTANTNYEWVICYTSGGTLKQYCPDD